jgi:TonB dependent receptor
VGQTTTGVFAQTEIEWTRTLRTTLGLRVDTYQFSVTSDNPANSGDGSDHLVSPKVGAVFGPWAGTEIYANAGFGFHSNDARGAVIRVDPASGDRVDPVTPLVKARGAEVGLGTVRIRGLQSTVALWYLGMDSELLFAGDAGTTEPGRPSRRVGVEWTNYMRLAPGSRSTLTSRSLAPGSEMTILQATTFPERWTASSPPAPQLNRGSPCSALFVCASSVRAGSSKTPA